MIEEFKECIDKDYIRKYEELTGEKFDEFIETLSSDMENLEDITTRDKNIKRMFLNVKRAKERWSNDKDLDQIKTISDEMKFIDREYKKVLKGEISAEKFKEYFNVTDPNEYRDKFIARLAVWKSDVSALLSDFPFVESLKKNSLKVAFKYDTLNFYLKFLLELEAQNKDESTTQVPTIFSDMLIDTTGRIEMYSEDEKKKFDECTDIMKLASIKKDVLADSNSADKLIMELEQNTYLEMQKGNSEEAVDLLTQIALVKAIKYMNALDAAIFIHYYNHFQYIILDEPIVKSLYRLEKDLGLSNCAKNDKAVTESLIKLRSILLHGNVSGVSDDKFSVGGNFLNCSIYQKDGITMVKVTLGGILKDLLLKKSAFVYNENIYNSLSNDAKQIATWLQRRRYVASISGNRNSDIFDIKNASFGIYWKSGRMDRKRKRVEDALEELKKNNLIVKAYKYDRKNSSIIIDYLPLDEKDLRLLDDSKSSMNRIKSVSDILN